MATRLPFSSEQYWNACKRNAFKGACMFTYEAGTTTVLKTTWTTADEAIAHPNPIQADANGIFPEIYGNGAFFIDIRNNAKDEIILQADNIQGTGTTSFTQFGSLIGNSGNDAISSLGNVGDFVETYEYDAGTGVGEGKYEIVAAATGVADGFLFIDKTDGSGNQLALINNGTAFIEQAGAVGDGDLILTGLPAFNGTDSTLAIQACINTLIAGTMSKIEAGDGIFNFTDLIFYDPFEDQGLRGNFVFTGSGDSNSVRLAAGTFDNGSVFKCTSTTGSFDVNTATITGGTAINFNTSMNSIEVGDLSVIGSTTGDLTRFDLVVGHSYIHDISIVNNQVAGVAMYCRSNFTTRFEGIDGRGSTPSAGNRVGTGLFYDTDFGAGSMATFISCTFGEFDDAWYIGHTNISAASHGGIGSSSVFLNCQGQRSNNNFHLGKTTDNIDIDGQVLLNFIGCYFELADLSNFLIEFDSSINLDKCEIRGGTATAGNILVQNEEATDIVQGGKISINNSLILNTPGSDFLILPAGSFYSVYSKENTGRSFGDTVYNLPSDYLGVMYCQNDQIEGIPITSTQYINRIEFIHPRSQVLIQREWHTGNDAGANDFSNRPSMPNAMLLGTLTADASIELPDGLTSIMSSFNSTIVKISAANTLNINSTATNIFINSGAAVSTVAITNNDWVFSLTSVNLGTSIRYYITTNDPTF